MMSRSLGRFAFLIAGMLSGPMIGFSQGASGDADFANQLRQVRAQSMPLIKDCRQNLGKLRSTGYNTSSLENALDRAEAMLNDDSYWKNNGGQYEFGQFEKGWVYGADGRKKLVAINPFGDYLAAGTSPRDGKLTTTTFDATGMVAKSQEWAKSLRQLTEKAQGSQMTQSNSFQKDIQEALNQMGIPNQSSNSGIASPGGIGAMELSNPYANDPSVVDLRGKKGIIDPADLQGDGKDRSAALVPLSNVFADTNASKMKPVGDIPKGSVSILREETPLTAPGYPIVATSELGTLDRADKQAILGSMTHEELESLDAYTTEKQARLTAAIEGIEDKEFGVQLAASVPADRREWSDAIWDKVLDTIPLARSMEALGKRAAGQPVEVNYVDMGKGVVDAEGLAVPISAAYAAPLELVVGAKKITEAEDQKQVVAASGDAAGGVVGIVLPVIEVTAAKTAETAASVTATSAVAAAAAFAEAEAGTPGALEAGAAFAKTGEAAAAVAKTGEGLAATAKIGGWALTGGTQAIDIAYRVADTYLYNAGCQDQKSANEALAIAQESAKSRLSHELQENEELKELISNQSARK